MENSCILKRLPALLMLTIISPKILRWLQCEGNTMFPSFAILNCQYIFVWTVTILSQPSSFSSFSPSAVSFFQAAGCMVSCQCLTSPHVQTFFGNYKQPSQPREAFVDSFPVCINIYQTEKHGHMSTVRRFPCVARWRAHSCLGLKYDPSIRFVLLRHSVCVWGGGGGDSLIAKPRLPKLICAHDYI